MTSAPARSATEKAGASTAILPSLIAIEYALWAITRSSALPRGSGAPLDAPDVSCRRDDAVDDHEVKAHDER